MKYPLQKTVKVQIFVSVEIKLMNLMLVIDFHHPTVTLKEEILEAIVCAIMYLKDCTKILATNNCKKWMI